MNSAPAAFASARQKGSVQRLKLRSPLIVTLNLLATIHIVWFYVNRVPSYLRLELYEAGRERMPFQARLLMQAPLHWAHASIRLGELAARLSAMKVWFPRGVRPEGILEAGVDLLAVMIAGLVARDLYHQHSETRLLSPFVYPLTLVMVAASYCVLTLHWFRYVYDLPSLGLFACSLYLIYRKYHPALFAAAFLVTTINRETSLFLLYFFVISSCMAEGRFYWRRALSWRCAGTVLPLALFWLAWHVWVSRHFAGLHSESRPRLLANVVTLLWPFAWSQLVGVCGYTLLLILALRGNIRSAELRLWLWVIPIWFGFMMIFGLVLEIRLFGELIPLAACTSALLAEHYVITKLNGHRAEMLS